jgi:hypothetical protein
MPIRYNLQVPGNILNIHSVALLLVSKSARQLRAKRSVEYRCEL